ncbi:MAG TPA: hypothetical protein VF530_17670 [Planctomycetota bacterium]
MPPSKLLRRLPALALLALASCSSTQLAEAWLDPDLKEMPQAQKVFVAYLGEDPSVQRVAEDAMAAHVPAAEVGRCYQLFPDSREHDPQKIKGKLREMGYELAVVMRVARVEEEVSWTGSTYPVHYRTFGSYWAYDSGTMRTDEIVHVETNLYSLTEDKLLYAARSETYNPSSAAHLVDDIAEAVGDDLDSKGILRPARSARR